MSEGLPDRDDERQAALRAVLAHALAELQPDLAARHTTTDTDAEETALALIALSAEISKASAALLADAVSDARHQQISWAKVGHRLGMSRQAAQQRFSTDALDPHLESRRESDEIWRLSPVSAVNEMGELQRHGVWGWHSIGDGIAYHDLMHDTV